MKYPATIVPVKAEEICRGPYMHPKKEGCGCLMFHADNKLLFGLYGDEYRSGLRRVANAIRRAAGLPHNYSVFGVYNDEATRDTQARVINKAFRLLGYRRKGKLLVWAGARKAKAKGKGRGK